MRKLVLASLLCSCFAIQAFAQFPPRIEDHFWRRKVVNRIDLNEKINAPLIKRESQYYQDNQYSDKEGLVMALFSGLKDGKFVAYHPDSLTVQFTYDDVLSRIQEYEGSLGEGSFDEGFGDEGDGSFEDFSGDGGFDDEFGGDEFGDFGDDFGGGDDLDGGFTDDGAGGMMGDFDPGPFENVIHFVEDRIFDKTRSDMIYDIQYIEIVWTDPGETLPEKRLCTFAYKEVLETLDNTQWKNRFNDAEYKTLREVFELRLFHSYIIDVSGEGLRSLPESEYRRQQLVEFEHHLWSY
ncbi:hypothetical protein [Pontibacter sp. G13]|uniref:hypothetical protein n=1 Tax=Pontibacter sp. G13 TaxID=3074898 RepID=UPI00288A25D0|nr:hypothetical protein [Pontibacter sp. G13]WNJ16244.1 hypothetical protein RJD25_15375 [Pontibacter sp. G13]